MNKEFKASIIHAAKTWDLFQKFDEKTNTSVHILTSKNQIRLILRHKQYVNTIPSSDRPDDPPLVLDRITLNLSAQYPTDRGEYCQTLACAQIPAYKIYSGMVGTTADQFDLYDIYKTITARHREIQRNSQQLDYTTNLLHEKIKSELGR